MNLPKMADTTGEAFSPALLGRPNGLPKSLLAGRFGRARLRVSADDARLVSCAPQRRRSPVEGRGQREGGAEGGGDSRPPRSGIRLRPGALPIESQRFTSN